MSDKDWPPKLKLTPEAAASLFLLAHGVTPYARSRDALVELFRLYWEDGYKAGKGDGGGAE